MEIRETFANKCNSILSNNVHPPVSFPSRGRNLFLKLEYEMPLVLSVLGGWRCGGRDILAVEETQEGARLELKCCCLRIRPDYIRKSVMQIISLPILGELILRMINCDKLI